MLIALCVIAAAASTTAHAQTLRWAARGDGRSMDPHTFAEGVNHNLNALVYDALVERDPRDAIVPALAIRWAQLDPLLWRFTLRPGVKFQDGMPLTAADVVFSIQRAQGPTSAFLTFARPLGTASAPDDATVELRLAQPNPILLRQLAAILIMSRDWAVKNQSERVPEYSAREQAPAARRAMGTGRFVPKERLPSVRTVFERNPSWWGRFEGNVAEVVYLLIENDATRTAALLSGDVNFAQDPAPQDLERLAAAPGLRLVNAVENRLIVFGFDQWRDELQYASVRGRNPFKDARVREAFVRAIGTDVLKASIMRGQSAPTGCMAIAPAGCLAPELEIRGSADVDGARRLMAEAGYADGFEVTLDCPNDRFLNDRALCVAMVGMLGRIGVRLKVEARPKSIHFGRVQVSDTSFFMTSWGGNDPDAQSILDSLLHSQAPAIGKGGFNQGRIADPELDRLIDAAAIEPDPAARATLIRDAQRRARDRAYYLPLHRQVLSWVSSVNVRPVITSDNLVRADWFRAE